MKKILLAMFFLTAASSVFASNDSLESQLEKVEDPFLSKCNESHQENRNSALAKNGIIFNEEVNLNDNTTEV